jgi:hypothetical protein
MSAHRALPVLLFALGALGSEVAVGQRAHYNADPRVTYHVYARDSYGYGRAAMITATSNAWIAQQEAYAKAIENRQKFARAYWEMQQEYRKQDREKKWSYVNAVKDRLERERELETLRSEMRSKSQPVSPAHVERVAAAQPPRQLSPSEVDPVTGVITWPRALKGADFSRSRLPIERFFRERSQASFGFKPTIGATQGVLNAIAEMGAKLRGRVSHTDPGEYVAARRFLDCLTSEIRRAENPAEENRWPAH